VRGTPVATTGARWHSRLPCALSWWTTTPLSWKRSLAGAGHDLATSHPDPALRSMPILVKPFNVGGLFAAVDRVLTAA
jgi:hypothetical protein